MKTLWTRLRLVAAVFGFIIGTILLMVWCIQNWMLCVALICLWGASDDWKTLKWRKEGQQAHENGQKPDTYNARKHEEAQP